MSSVAENAKELFEKFRTASRHKYLERTGQDADEQGKALALLVIDEIIKAIYNIEGDDMPIHDGKKWVNCIDYYKAIQKEIENIAI